MRTRGDRQWGLERCPAGQKKGRRAPGRFLSAALAVFLLAALFGGDRAAGEEPDTADTFYWALTRDPGQGVMPWKLVGGRAAPWPAHSEEAWLAAMLHTGLIESPAEAAAEPLAGWQPALASDWRGDQSGSWAAFALAAEARWSDGTAVTADDVAATWQAYLAARPGLAQRVDEVRVLGERLIYVNLKGGDDGAVLSELAEIGILPAWVVTDEGGRVDLGAWSDPMHPYRAGPVTAGAYRVEGVVPGHQWALAARREGYPPGLRGGADHDLPARVVLALVSPARAQRLAATGGVHLAAAAPESNGGEQTERAVLYGDEVQALIINHQRVGRAAAALAAVLNDWQASGGDDAFDQPVGEFAYRWIDGGMEPDSLRPPVDESAALRIVYPSGLIWDPAPRPGGGSGWGAGAGGPRPEDLVGGLADHLRAAGYAVTLEGLPGEAFLLETFGYRDFDLALVPWPLRGVGAPHSPVQPDNFIAGRSRVRLIGVAGRAAQESADPLLKRIWAGTFWYWSNREEPGPLWRR
ncbi:MAG: ABC transporter substrate-binding protein [Thermaerobacterales bacterium]